MKKIYYLILVGCLMLISLKGVEAACVTPVENLNPNISLTISGSNPICYGTYYLNDTDDNGVFIFNTSNRVYECNGTIIIGNAQSLGRGATLRSNSNQTLWGCTFINFDRGIYPNWYNLYLYNNTLINSSSAGVYYEGGVNNLIVENNTFINSSIYAQNNDHIKILRNNFSGCGVQKCGSTPYYSIELVNTYNTSIWNNDIDSGEIGIMDFSTKGLLNISNNIISNHDRGISITDRLTKNITIINNNSFINNTNNYDAYQLDIEVLNASNIDISNNNMLESVDASINMQMVSNILIRNNSFNLICVSNRTSYLGNAQNEPCMAVKIGQLFKTWNYRSCAVSPYVMGCAKNTLSSNITMLDNAFNNETVVFLYLEGVTGLINNLPLNYNRTFAFSNLTSNNVLYINSNKTSIYNGVRSYNANSTYYNNLYVGTENTIFGYYGINSTTQYYRNDNATQKFNINITDANVYSPNNDAYNISTSTVLSNNFNILNLNLDSGMGILIGNYQSDTTCSYGNYTAYPNNDANLGLDISTPVSNNVANIDFLETTCTIPTPPINATCDGTSTCNFACGTNWTGNVNMRLNLLNFTGSGTTYLLGNITNSTTKVGQCNIKLNGQRLN